jgi:hypothetical protein
MFGTAQHSKRRRKSLKLIKGYTEELIAESQVGALARLENLQMSGKSIAFNQLEELCDMCHGVDGEEHSNPVDLGLS